MSAILCVVAVSLILLVLLDGFEAMVLPRRVTRRYRPARFYYYHIWRFWKWLAHRFAPGRRRETCLSLFGPLSILTLFALWVAALVVAFGLLHWSLETPLQIQVPEARAGLGAYLYLSGVTFFTLGYGDVVARNGVGWFLSVTEAGTGLGFIALMIGYLPVLYQAFSRREVTISLLDARAGSPPQVILRLAESHHCAGVDALLVEWERWSAELLESHVSFPVLAFYRSQHDNQSWLAALTVILDTCALVLTTLKGAATYQARLTLAMARHAAVDLALVFNTPPLPLDPDRLSAERLARLRALLIAAGLEVREGKKVDEKLAELRAMYEPFVNALGRQFEFAIPPIMPEQTTVDNWQTSAWTRRTANLAGLPLPKTEDDHFD